MNSGSERQRRRHSPQRGYAGPCRRAALAGSEEEGTGTAHGDNGCVESRNRLVQENLGLVLRVARQFQRRGLSLDDLVGEGNLGLIRAAQRFDPSLGTRFSTFATCCIREAIREALATTSGTIRLPMNISRLMERWHRTEKALRQSRGHPPTFEEVATAMELGPPARRLITQAHRAAQLRKGAIDCVDSPAACLLMLDEGATAEESLTEREERESITRRLERLEATERTVVLLKFGLSGEPPLGFEQIGGRLGMTMTAVQKAVATAIRKLGRHPEGHHNDPSPCTRAPGRLMVG